MCSGDSNLRRSAIPGSLFHPSSVSFISSTRILLPPASKLPPPSPIPTPSHSPPSAADGSSSSSLHEPPPPPIPLKMARKGREAAGEQSDFFCVQPERVRGIQPKFSGLYAGNGTGGRPNPAQRQQNRWIPAVGPPDRAAVLLPPKPNKPNFHWHWIIFDQPHMESIQCF